MTLMVVDIVEVLELSFKSPLLLIVTMIIVHHATVYSRTELWHYLG